MGASGPRILFALGTGEPGGAELSILALLHHRPPELAARALLLSPGPLEASLAHLGLPVATAGLVGRPGALQAARFERGLLSELRRARPDVIHATGIKAALMVFPAARTLGIPLVWHKVDFAYDGSLSGPLSSGCAGVIAVSRAVGAAVRGGRLIDVLHPPVGLAEDFRVAAERPPATIGSVGRLVPYKGHHHVIEAAGRLRPSFPEVEVVIAGGGAREASGYGEDLLSSARRWGMEDRVRFLGHVERIEDVLSDLTVSVTATYRDELGFGHEGLSGAMLEASWAGLPVVATRGGGTPEGVKDGVTGTLVDPEDPSGLAEAIAAYLSEPELARAAGEEGARFARARCRPDALATRLFADLAAVAARHPPPLAQRRSTGLRPRRVAR